MRSIQKIKRGGLISIPKEVMNLMAVKDGDFVSLTVTEKGILVKFLDSEKGWRVFNND